MLIFYSNFKYWNKCYREYVTKAGVLRTWNETWKLINFFKYTFLSDRHSFHIYTLDNGVAVNKNHDNSYVIYLKKLFILLIVLVQWCDKYSMHVKLRDANIPLRHIGNNEYEVKICTIFVLFSVECVTKRFNYDPCLDRKRNDFFLLLYMPQNEFVSVCVYLCWSYSRSMNTFKTFRVLLIASR